MKCPLMCIFSDLKIPNMKKGERGTSSHRWREKAKLKGREGWQVGGDSEDINLGKYGK